MEKFTAIYNESWVSGSHRYSMTQMRRIERLEGETIEDMLNRENLSDLVEYLFHGHSPLQGETEWELNG